MTTRAPRPRLEDALSPRRVLSSETVFSGRIWDVRRDGFELAADGDTIYREYVDHTGAVAVLPIDEEGRILLLKQYRHPVGMDLWEIPAGLLDVDGEPNVEAAARELAEEADLVADEWHVLVDFFTTPGGSSEAIRIYVARGLHQVPAHERHVRTAEEAEIELVWVSLEEAVTAVLEGRLHNPSAVVAILAVEAARRRGFASLRPADAPWTAHPRQRG